MDLSIKIDGWMDGLIWNRWMARQKDGWMNG